MLPPVLQVRVTPMRTEVIIRATRTQNVLGECGRGAEKLTDAATAGAEGQAALAALHAATDLRGYCCSCAVGEL